MSLLIKLAEIIKEEKKEVEKNSKPTFHPAEINGSAENIIACGDNISFMKYLLNVENKKEFIQMIYVDPPFFSKANYSASLKVGEKTIKPLAYEDRWTQGEEAYLRMLCKRLYLMKELLKDTGIICVHLDWHIVHYAKIMMDEIFGKENFINEIIWQYKSGGTSKKHFAKKHDTILMYSKRENYYIKIGQEKSYNRNLKPYKFKGVKEYKDDIGWHTLVNMKDVWNFDMVGRTSIERTGYATQKPEQLIKRIIESCSQEGDICADFFGGSGTVAKVAEEMHRGYISCDVSEMAVAKTEKRLLERNYRLFFENYKVNGKIEISAVNGELTIKNYNISEKNLPLKKEDLKYIKEILRKDSLMLVDYYTIDYDYNGIIHKPEVIIKRDKSQLLIKHKLKKEAKNISVRSVDIFGNISEKILEV